MSLMAHRKSRQRQISVVACSDFILLELLVVIAGIALGAASLNRVLYNASLYC